jgi:multiple sugar transport system substrate-binding protein
MKTRTPTGSSTGRRGGGRRPALGLGALALCLCTLATATGCGRQETGITFMVGGEPNEVAYWGTLIDDYERLSGLRVRVIVQPSDSDQRREGLVVPLRSAEADPDVFLMDVVWIPQFAASDWLEPLDGYAEEEGLSLDPFFAGIVDLADRYEGALCALPLYIDGGLLYYRKDLLAEYGLPGPPSTWDELVKYSRKVQDGEREGNGSFYGFVWQGAQYEGLVCNFLEFASSSGGGEGGSRLGFSLEAPEDAAALRFMSDLIHEYEISPPSTYTEMKEEECRIFFQAGNALFERNWPYAWSLHEEAGSPVRGVVGVARLPHFGGGRSASALGGWHVGISRSSDRKTESWSFVKFITSFETQKKLALNLGWNPARTDVYEDAAVKESIPHLALLKGIFESAVPRPTAPYYSRLSDVMQRYLNACLSGKMGATDAMSEIRLEADRLHRQYADAR